MSKKVLITGSRGIAAALVAQLSNKDYSIYIVGGEEQDCQALSAQFSQVKGYSAIDIRDEQLVIGAFDQAIKQLDGLDQLLGDQVAVLAMAQLKIFQNRPGIRH
jgi:NAD(P)-dependent dehydrogenase (short-subunit alcohol dehydrogenase family)